MNLVWFLFTAIVCVLAAHFFSAWQLKREHVSMLKREVKHLNRVNTFLEKWRKRHSRMMQREIVPLKEYMKQNWGPQYNPKYPLRSAMSILAILSQQYQQMGQQINHQVNQLIQRDEIIKLMELELRGGDVDDNRMTRIAALIDALKERECPQGIAAQQTPKAAEATGKVAKIRPN